MYAGEKPHLCSHCGKGFALATALDRNNLLFHKNFKLCQYFVIHFVIIVIKMMTCDEYYLIMINDYD